MWADWYNAAEIQRNYSKERRTRCSTKHYENTDCEASEDHCILQEHRGSLLKYRADTICIEYFGYLLSGISHRDCEYNKVTQLPRKIQSIRKLQSIGVPGGSVMLIKSVFFYIVMSLEAFIYCFVGEYLSTKVSMNYNADIVILFSRLEFIVRFRVKWSEMRCTNRIGTNWVQVRIEMSS